MNRYCVICLADISHRAANAKYCVECATTVKYQTANRRRQDRNERRFPPAMMRAFATMQNALRFVFDRTDLDPMSARVVRDALATAKAARRGTE